MMRSMLALLVLLVLTHASFADRMRMAVTTSFHNSGLADVLLPEVEKDLGLEVQLLVVGTGQAIRLGEAGDVDAVLVHSKAAEEEFVASGHGLHRREIMYNDFVIIGPPNDPAVVGTANSAVEAMSAIAAENALFVSRGDDSGTHAKELGIWAEAKLDPMEFGSWYRSVGAGMGAALNTASGMAAYILADRASWLNFRNKADLKLLFAGDPILFNQYSLLPVNPEFHEHVKAELVAALEEWMTSPKAEALINGYRINGEGLFTFNAIR